MRKNSYGLNVSSLTPRRVFVGIFLFIGLSLIAWSGKIVPKGITLLSLPTPVPSAYKNISLIARSAYVFDGATGKELFSKNGDAQLPLASIAKIMTAVTALSLTPADTKITVTAEYLKGEGDSGLYANEVWRLSDLLDLTLVESSNDGANAIAAVAGAFEKETSAALSGRDKFVNAMNVKAKELGLKQTYFLNPTGLDESPNVSGAYGSAKDVSVLFYYAIHTYPKLFGGTRYENREFDSLSLLKHKVKNTNMFVGKIPSLLGSKTGYTDLAGGNLTIAFDAGPNHPVIVTVLGSTERGRFEDAEKLVWNTLDYLRAE